MARWFGVMAWLLSVPVTATAADGLMSRQEISLGVDMGGPVVFRDTPDRVLEETQVFAYGTRVGFQFGEETVDAHRFGLAVGVRNLARSNTRLLAGITPELTYETGYPVALEVGLGGRIPIGTAGFRENYGGISTATTLRYAPATSTALRVSPGLEARAVLNPANMAYTTVFGGIRLDLTWHTHRSGGAS